MNDTPRPNDGITRIAPYVPGKSRVAGAREPFAKLSSNESPLGASPDAIAAAGAVLNALEIYPDPGASALREAVGEVHGLDPARIVCGNGSDELLHLIAQSYLGPGDEAVISQYGFLVYPIVTHAAGAVPVIAAERDYCADVDALLGAVTAKTKIVFLANPNNPTGTCLGPDDLVRLHAGLRPDILLVLDAAYAEYVTAPDYDPGTALVDAAQNVVMVRTFSKMGLAALRAGWLYGPAHLVDTLNRIRGPFNINAAAIAAAAAAVRDTGFTARLCAHNAKWRDWLTAELNSNAIRVLPSQGNFILALFGEGSPMSAPEAFQALAARGIIVREMGSYGIPDGLRISVGSEEAMRAVAEVLKGDGS